MDKLLADSGNFRIVFLCRRYCPGEAWTNRVLAYAKGFAEQGQNVRIIFLISDSHRNGYEIDIPGVEIVNLWETDCFAARHNRKISYAVNLFRFRHLIRKGDNIFVYGADRNLLGAALSLKYKAKVFCEVTEHPFKGRNDGLIHHLGSKWRRTLLKLDGLFVISRSLKEYFIGEGMPPQKVNVINMFVDTSRFENLCHGSEEDYIAYCGVISTYKDGVDTLLKAFSVFHKTYGNYKLYLVGRFVSDSVRDEIESMVEALELKDSVHMTGQISPSEMPRLLYDARMLVLARPDNVQAMNGFPTKLGEYLATGNPTVVTKVGEIPFFLRDGDNAFLAEPDNAASFAGKMLEVASDYDRARQIGMNGKELAYKDFSYKTQTAEALRIISNTL